MTNPHNGPQDNQVLHFAFTFSSEDSITGVDISLTHANKPACVDAYAKSAGKLAQISRNGYSRQLLRKFTCV